MAKFGERRAEIYGRGRFTDTAFLISDRYDFHLGSRGMNIGATWMMMLPVAANRN